MQRATIALLFPLALAFAQTPANPPPDLKFEVASLKPSAPDVRGGQIKPSQGGERYIATGVSLKLMLQVAYRLKADQIVGGPSWIDTDRFDMQAKAGEAVQCRRIACHAGKPDGRALQTPVSPLH